MKKNKRLPLLLLATGLLVACYQPRPVKPFYPLDEDMRAWFAVPEEGAWFLYLNRYSGQYDTMTVEYRNSAISALTPYMGEGYKIQYRCSFNPDFLTRVTTTEDAYNFTISYPVGGAHSFSKKDGQYIPEETVTLLDSLEVSGTVYREVLRTTQEGVGYGPSYRKLYFAKGIGIIRKERVGAGGTSADPVFDLVDYRLP
jgi:hypothetical protein